MAWRYCCLILYPINAVVALVLASHLYRENQGFHSCAVRLYCQAEWSQDCLPPTDGLVAWMWQLLLAISAVPVLAADLGSGIYVVDASTARSDAALQ